ncbi:nucleotidyl transferase AbiEii/AbiGii toxin family protein [Sandaracinus amylolyticus]|uniref:nucleotidyl transferase AbiEii/AbiGii toxin family protein n=1 Tax=Sandaracinus amylolyticus TaxID=927083 RepID=UPI001F1B0C0F|nr:nucleotidyl transferase AbiEii/AbiGii toxin family protein [Sandaracinus amylolyticus]UJR86671.1 Hypothetical protein I5071_87720 [Sandaracinus amylolyticus]
MLNADALPDDFRDLLVALVDARAEFVLVGGYALAAYGHVRGTDDLDVFVRPTAENARRVFDALVAFGARVAAHGVTAGLFAKPGYGYRVGIKPHLVELLTEIDGVSFDDASRDPRVVHVEGRQVPIIGRGALLANKRAAARPKDLADVEWLERHGDHE